MRMNHTTPLYLAVAICFCCWLLVCEAQNTKQGKSMEWFQGKDLPLQKAMDADDPSAVDAAVQAGANINAMGLHGVNPLEYAIGHFRKRAYARLLQLHADPAQRDDEKDNAMTLATKAYAKDPDYLQLALQAGGDPNTRRADNDPIIIRFVNDRNLDAIRMLKAKGADIDIRDRGNDPIIITAGLMQYWDVVWCLLELGARFDYNGDPYTMQDLFRPRKPSPTPPDSPLWPYKVKSWKFMRQHGLVLPDLAGAN
jgi:ankyrin repeat protein